jgi:hypothetical protein
MSLGLSVSASTAINQSIDLTGWIRWSVFRLGFLFSGKGKHYEAGFGTLVYISVSLWGVCEVWRWKLRVRHEEVDYIRGGASDRAELSCFTVPV